MKIENIIASKKKSSVLIALVVFAVYGNSIFNSYNIDDDLATKNHPKTGQGFSAICEIWSTPYYEDAFNQSYEYRPV